MSFQFAFLVVTVRNGVNVSGQQTNRTCKHETSTRVITLSVFSLSLLSLFNNNKKQHNEIAVTKNSLRFFIKFYYLENLKDEGKTKQKTMTQQPSRVEGENVRLIATNEEHRWKTR